MKKYLAENKYLVLGHLYFLALLLLAAKYTDVRVLLTDSAYQVFYDINHPGILINDSRYSMVLTQILPWIAIHLHLPLKLVLISYSVSFILVGYACWLITAYAMKQRQAATLMLFVLLGIGGTFLHCISESFQLMFYVPMLYAWMCQGERLKVKGEIGKTIAYYIILALLVALAFFIYPMAVFYILFAIGFQMISIWKTHPALTGTPPVGRGRATQDGCNSHSHSDGAARPLPSGGVPARAGWARIAAVPIATLAFLLLFILLYWLIGPSGHDSEFVPTLPVIFDSLLHFFSLGSFETFIFMFPRLYLAPTVLLVITLIGYSREKQWWKFWYLLGYFVAFLVASCIIYQTGDSRISRERYFIPLFFIIGLPFLVDELPRFTKRQEQWWFWIFIALILFAFGRIMHYIHEYEPRLEAITEVSQMAEKQGQHKLIVTRSTAEEVFPLDIWGLALESMLYTAEKGPEHTVTIYKEEDDFDRSNADLYQNPEVYVSVNWWKRWEVRDLNPHYFRLPAQGYKELVKDENGYRLVDL